jgi:hypothetical protein
VAIALYMARLPASAVRTLPSSCARSQDPCAS